MGLIQKGNGREVLFHFRFLWCNTYRFRSMIFKKLSKVIWRVSPKCSSFLVILIEVPLLTGCLFVYVILINLFFCLLRVEFLNLSKGTSSWFSFIRWLWVWSPGDNQNCPSSGMWWGWRLPPYCKLQGSWVWSGHWCLHRRPLHGLRKVCFTGKGAAGSPAVGQKLRPEKLVFGALFLS